MLLLNVEFDAFQTAQDHAAQVNKLRAAKEEVDAKQVQMQREMKEEIERLRTQFIFKVMLSKLDIPVVLTSWTSNMKWRLQLLKDR